MKSQLLGEERELHDRLIDSSVAKRRAIELQNLMLHCNYQTFCIDPEPTQIPDCDMIVATLQSHDSVLPILAERAREKGVTLCIIAPALDSERNAACKDIVEKHRCTSVDNRAYLLLFNNHLPKQRFKL